MQKNKTGLIIASAIAALVVVLYFSFRAAPKQQTETVAVAPTAASPQGPRTILTAQSREVEKNDILAFTPGQPGGAAAPPAGSWFSLELVSGFSTYVGIQPGPDGGIVIGKAQPATGSHPGQPDGKEKAGIDTPWVFFGSTGMHFTSGSGIKFVGNGQLDFSGWRWTWNGVPEIDMGAGKIASFNWVGEPGKPFTLEYQTIIPKSDTPGFDGKKYTLHLEGVVKRQ